MIKIKNLESILYNVENIFFDFDGVILDSNDCKTNAFYEMYLSYGRDIADQVKEYHKRNGGISRYEKFKYWEKKYFNRDIDKEELKNLADIFSKKVKNNVINSKEVDGSINFIKTIHSNVKLWIISGTPQDELRDICNEINISEYFEAIYGSPNSKKYWTEKIISDNNLNRENTLFIGDALADYDAAIFSKIKFLLIESEDNKSLFKKIKNISRISNFK